jgi:tetratricopeptide (TPR) repeat protein
VVLWQKGIALRPFLALLHASHGEALAQLGLFAETEAAFRAAAADDDDVHTLRNLGAIQLNLGKTDEAAATLRIAFNRNPSSLGATSHLAMTLKRQEKFEEAESLLSRAASDIAAMSNQDLAKEGLRRAEVFTELGQRHKQPYKSSTLRIRPSTKRCSCSLHNQHPGVTWQRRHRY